MNLSKKASAFVLVLLPVIAMAGSWTVLPNYPTPICKGGSALCYGPHNGHKYVWLMHGPDDYQRFLFHRRDVDSAQASWAELSIMPQDETDVGWGGALTYVPDPNANPASGWILAMKGGGTDEFYVYEPSENAWDTLPSCLEEVTAGGSLCYGGTFDDTAFVYSLTGNEVADGEDYYATFCRFKFDVNDGPASGVWDSRRQALGRTDSGAALAWCVLPTGTEYGLVYRESGHECTDLQMYEPLADSWGSRPLGEFGGGGAMATGPGGDPTIWIFRGHACTDWWCFDVCSNFIKQFTQQYFPNDVTWRLQVGGAAMCSDGEFVYAELGNTTFREFRKYVPGDDEEGGQGSTVAGSSLAVQVVAGTGVHRFGLTSARPGPVALRIVDPCGRTVSLTRAASAAGSCDLAWEHGRAASGVYFYRLEASGESAIGKVTVVK